MGTIITTENTPVRRIGIRWYLIINTAFTIFLPESDILDDSLFSLWLLFWMFAGFLVWALFGDGVYSSEPHRDTARPIATET